ncbi:MAG: bifunctional glutamate N-acetyltransferase/amino-acid acetyltransferase ArgJ [Promethearchaeota archaeon]
MNLRNVNGNVTYPKGFKTTGVSIGIKNGNKDLALICSDVPANVAGVFTKNIVKASPVIWDQKIVKKGLPVRSIVANSGNANACTGDLGYRYTEMMAKKTAELLGIKSSEVLICSTGVIGVQLPIDIILNGIDKNFKKMGYEKLDGDLAAEAIMTTDTVPKKVAVEFETGLGVTIRIGGMAKGSGMIHPNMGTMLSFITTDANISSVLLNKALKESVEDSYNMISVDGDTSTNDTVLVVANGMAENSEIIEENKDYNLFKEALHHVNLSLAQQIVKDGEGAGKFITVKIKGAPTKNDARLLCKSVIASNLVKTAFFGEDANWGRILAAMGYSGAEFDPDKVTIQFKSQTDSVDLIKNGVPLQFDEKLALKILKNEEIMVEVLLKDGDAEATAWGCDLSYKYVEINADYRT